MKKNFKTILLDLKDDVATLTLNRPEFHNAFNEAMIRELHAAFKQLDKDKQVRAVILQGNGKSFSAGADLHWMKKAAAYKRPKNIKDAKALHQMLSAVQNCSKPVIAKVHGAALGGACGLVAAADMAYAFEDAQFGFTEVRLGLIPAVIAPFVLKKIGVGYARQFFLTGERFGAPMACRIGLIEGEGAPEEMEAVIAGHVRQILQAAPGAVAAAKRLLHEISGLPLSRAGLITARRIAERRAGAEAKEGMEAFFNKRPPSWVKHPYEN